MKALFILYVKDQEISTRFYKTVLDKEPALHVPGMTEFTLVDGSSLGLMPSQGIKRLLPGLPDPEKADGVPRSEVYLTVSDAAVYHRRALAAGATELSSLSERPWGDIVAYSLDPDGHVLAFAEAAQPA
jgi:catechol 2,3-dioxygenase-like lactoylglutathione lyase family enzyme